jgi:lipopolysaccharide/colanic/teichoic acid biosynthesis glycosyltransferase
MRRLVDILFSAAVLVLLSPILAAIALAVAIDSPGPVLYGARRCGRDGRIFRMWKFRTMRTGADRAGLITGRNDSRVTQSGRLLRRTKLDELPQFLNVLLGHMTLIGPRPESPEIVALYTPAQRAVLRVKPGVTGVVQLEAGEESDSIPDGVKPQQYYVEHLMAPKLRMDLDYLRLRTPLSDTWILARTAAYVLRCAAGRKPRLYPVSSLRGGTGSPTVRPLESK